MKKEAAREGEMRDEYDFSQSVRAPYAAMAGGARMVVLDADVGTAFPSSAAVNEALRLLIETARRAQGSLQPKEAAIAGA